MKGRLRPASVASGAGALAAGTVLAALLGLLLQSLIGYFFGAGAQTDAYFMSLSIIAFLAKVLMFGHLKSIALPTYVRLRASDPAEGGAFLRALSWQIGLALAALTALALVLAPVLVATLAPGYTGAVRELTVTLLRIRAPALFLLGAVTVGLILLETAGRFGRVALGQRVLPAAVSVVLLAWLGSNAGIVGLGWIGLAGAVVGGCALIAFSVVARGEAGSPGPSGAARAALKDVWRRWAGFGWSNAATTLAEWVYRVAASTLGPGLFSAVVFGRMVHDLLHGALNDAATTVALPRFASVREGDGEGGVGAALGVGLETLSAVTVPIAAFVAVTSGWIAAALFGRGELIRAGMLGPISVSMSIFMLGFVVQGRNQLGFQAAFAAGHSSLVNRVQVIGHVVRALALLPAVWLWSFVGLVVAQVGMNVVVALAFWTLAPAELGTPRGRWAGGLLVGLGRIGLATLVPTALLAATVLWILPSPAGAGELTRVGVLASAAAGWGASTWGLARMLRVPLFIRPGFK